MDGIIGEQALEMKTKNQNTTRICETVYQLVQSPDPDQQFQPDQDQAFVLNVTKTRNYDNCLTEPTIVSENMTKEDVLRSVANRSPSPQFPVITRLPTPCLIHT